MARLSRSLAGRCRGRDVVRHAPLGQSRDLTLLPFVSPVGEESEDHRRLSPSAFPRLVC